jgi:hypothetical protein
VRLGHVFEIDAEGKHNKGEYAALVADDYLMPFLFLKRDYLFIYTKTKDLGGKFQNFKQLRLYFILFIFICAYVLFIFLYNSSVIIYSISPVIETWVKQNFVI